MFPLAWPGIVLGCAVNCRLLRGSSSDGRAGAPAGAEVAGGRARALPVKG
ncbi:hypothetical protein [Streptomyces sp. NPDC001272]